MIPVTINGEVTIWVASPLACAQEICMDPELAKVLIVAMIVVGVLIAPYVWTRSTK